MTKFALITLKQSENSLDALISSEKRLEAVNYEIYTDIGEAYEKLVQSKQDGLEAIVLSQSLIVDLAAKVL